MSAQPRPRHRRPPLAIVQAIGPDGWAVAERVVDRPTTIVVEETADLLRAAVRSDTGWIPRIVVLDGDGRDVTDRYRVD